MRFFLAVCAVVMTIFAVVVAQEGVWPLTVLWVISAGALLVAAMEAK